MYFKVHKDNAGALTLLITPPPHLCTAAKHYMIKTIWFCEQIVACNINVERLKPRSSVEIFLLSFFLRPFTISCIFARRSWGGR